MTMASTASWGKMLQAAFFAAAVAMLSVYLSGVPGARGIAALVATAPVRDFFTAMAPDEVCEIREQSAEMVRGDISVAAATAVLWAQVDRLHNIDKHTEKSDLVMYAVVPALVVWAVVGGVLCRPDDVLRAANTRPKPVC